MSHVDGVSLFKGRVVIPNELREEVLETLYNAHQGVPEMLSVLRLVSGGQDSLQR